MRRLIVWTCMVIALSFPGFGQHHPKAALDVALKQVELAKRKFGHEQLAALTDALATLQTIVEKFPGARAEKARALLEIGRIKTKLGDFGGAEIAWNQAAAITSESRCATDALIELASMLRRRHKVVEAQAALEAVVKSFANEPRNHAEALLRLASLHRAEKRPEASEVALRRCLAEHLDIRVAALDALDALVVLKLDQSQPTEATKIFTTVSQELRARYRDGRDASRTALALERIALRLKFVGPTEGRP